MKVGILGGGITGLALQRFLKCDSEILEASSKPGGLCSTITTPQGFSYDIGGHVFLSKYEKVNKIIDELMGDNLHFRPADTKQIYYNGKFLPYPFYKNISLLEKEEIFECVNDFLNRDDDGFPLNLEEWFYCHYGRALSDKNMIPYTSKLWNIPCKDMAVTWADKRIPRLTREDLLRSALGLVQDSEPTYFRYPKRGGFGAICEAMQKPGGRISCNYTVVDIHWNGERYQVTDQALRTKHFDRIIITFPIHEAIKCFRDVPNDVQIAVSNLVYNSISLVSISHDFDININQLIEALYIPDKDMITHRIFYPGFFSESMIIPNKFSFVAEITTNPGDGIHELTDQQLIDIVASDTKNRFDIYGKIEAHVTRCKYGYPVYTLDYEHNMSIVKKYFNRINVPLCGRFAQFEYINSDECIKRAMDLAEQFNNE